MRPDFRPALGVLNDGMKNQELFEAMKRITARSLEMNKGYMTVEASIVVPVVLFGVFMCLFGLMLIYEKGYGLGNEYEALYTIPFSHIRDNSVDAYLSNKNYTYGVVLGEASVETGYSWHKAKCQGVLKLYGDSEINADREIDVLVERLRRWQFYDDIAEDQGHE